MRASQTPRADPGMWGLSADRGTRRTSKPWAGHRLPTAPTQMRCEPGRADPELRVPPMAAGAPPTPGPAWTCALYLLPPATQGAPPRCPGHGFLLGGEVLRGKCRSCRGAGGHPRRPPGPLPGCPCPTRLPGHWSSRTRTSSPSSRPRRATRWLDPGHWRPSERAWTETSAKQGQDVGPGGHCRAGGCSSGLCLYLCAVRRRGRKPPCYALSLTGTEPAPSPGATSPTPSNVFFFSFLVSGIKLSTSQLPGRRPTAELSPQPLPCFETAPH